MVENLKFEFPSQGWKQFLTSREEMLDAFDRAREKAKSHEVETYHGKVAEAEFRKWLSSFLPKRYGVTAGYIVSSGLKSSEKTPHFDVIIYDQLESPILWIEDNPDVSTSGRSLAIPVEQVRCVLEVKSALSPRTVTDALEHLADLSPVMGGMDAPGERYKLHLPPTFSCGLVFFELKREFQFSEAVMSKLISGAGLRGFFGGIVLRGEGHSVPMTGRLSLSQSETPMGSLLKEQAGLLDGMVVLSQSTQIADNFHLGSMLMWTEFNFSQFAFDLIAMMQGSYDGRFLSSFYGMGSSQSEKTRQNTAQ